MEVRLDWLAIFTRVRDTFKATDVFFLTLFFILILLVFLHLLRILCVFSGFHSVDEELFLFVGHFVVFIAQLRHLQSVSEENNNTVVEKGWSLIVVVAFKFYNVFVTCVLGVKLVTVVRLDKIVLLAMGEHTRDEAFINVINR